MSLNIKCGLITGIKKEGTITLIYYVSATAPSFFIYIFAIKAAMSSGLIGLLGSDISGIGGFSSSSNLTVSSGRSSVAVFAINAAISSGLIGLLGSAIACSIADSST